MTLCRQAELGLSDSDLDEDERAALHAARAARGAAGGSPAVAAAAANGHAHPSALHAEGEQNGGGAVDGGDGEEEEEEEGDEGEGLEQEDGEEGDEGGEEGAAEVRSGERGLGAAVRLHRACKARMRETTMMMMRAKGQARGS